MRRAIARRRAREEREKEERRLLETLDGRQNVEVQTDLYLEELAEQVDEFDAGCQTDDLLDRPESPLFVAGKSGVDAATQVFEGDVRALFVCSYRMLLQPTFLRIE